MKTLAQVNNYKYIKDINAIYGESHGYYFYLESTQYVSLIRLNFTIEDLPDNQLKAQLDTICDGYRAVSHEGLRFESGEAIIELRPQGFDDPKELKQLIDALTLKMKELGVRQAVNGTTTDLGLYRDGTHLVVRNNAEQSKVDGDLSKIYRKQSNSPIEAFLMAFVYMIPAIVLYAVVLNIGFVSSFICYAILFQAFKGFDRYSLGATRTQVWVLLIMALFGIILGWYLSVVFMVAGQLGGNTLQFLMTIPFGEVLAGVAPGIGIAVLFNYQSIRAAFAGAREDVVVSRKIKKLM